MAMQHFWRDIKGWASFRELYEEMVKAAPADTPSHFVEIGSWFGKSAVYMAVEIANSGKPIKFDCVDPWTDGGADLKHKTVGWEKDALYKAFIRNIQPVRHYITAVRERSLDAAPRYEDASLDFVMIDGDHSYEACLADIDAWLPKVKKGGVIAGDDYNWSGVKRAVRDRFDMRDVDIRSHQRVDNRTLKSFEYWVHKV
jgi:predicted O-methyltransferase YrrM